MRQRGSKSPLVRKKEGGHVFNWQADWWSGRCSGQGKALNIMKFQGWRSYSTCRAHIINLQGRVVKSVGRRGHDEAMEAGGREFDPRPGHYSRMSF